MYAELNYTHIGAWQKRMVPCGRMLCANRSLSGCGRGSVRLTRCGLLPKIASQLEAYHDHQMKWELEVEEARTTLEQVECEWEARGLEAERAEMNGGTLIQLEQARLVELCRELTGKAGDWKQSQHTDNVLLEKSRQRLAERRRMLQRLRENNQALQNRTHEVVLELRSKSVEQARAEQEEVMLRTLKNQRLEEAARQTNNLERGEDALKAATELLGRLRENVSSDQKHARKLSDFVLRFAHSKPPRSTSVGRKGRNVANGAGDPLALRREATTLIQQMAEAARPCGS